MSKDDKIGLLLLAFGGVGSLEEIEPFLANILKGRNISPEFVEKTQQRYKLIGGKSPLLDITEAQAEGIVEILNREGERYKPYVGMLHWQPYIKDTLARMKADGIEKAAAFVMAPFTSPVATGAYEKVLDTARAGLGGVPKVRLLSNWHIHPRFIDLLIEKLDEALGAFEKTEDALVIFSNHSLPRELTEGDAYEMKINQTVDEITSRMELDYRVAFQSQGTSRVTWLGPRTEDVIEEAKKAGKKGVVVMPLCFVADHVETLYDIDILFKATAENLGLIFSRTASLNTTPAFLELLADIVKRSGEIY